MLKHALSSWTLLVRLLVFVVVLIAVVAGLVWVLELDLQLGSVQLTRVQ